MWETTHQGIAAIELEQKRKQEICRELLICASRIVKIKCRDNEVIVVAELKAFEGATKDAVKLSEGVR